MDKTNIINEITPLSNSDCFYIADRYKTEFTYPIHRHKEYELNFCERASGVKRIVGDSTVVIGDYDLVLITGSNLEHVWEQHNCVSQDVREITIQFSPELFFKNFEDKNQFRSIKKMLEDAQCGLSFPIHVILKIYPLIDSLSREKDFYAVLKFLQLLHELSVNLDSATILSSTSFAGADHQSDSRRVKKIETYINNNYHKKLRLSELASLVGMTPVAFSKFFKVRTGKSVMEYIIDIRLGFAARMLVDSTMSVIEISYDCGFNNISNFNRIFKKKKSCSPKEFRNMYKIKKKRCLI